MTVTEIIEETCEEIFDNYCKYREQAEDESKLEEICDKCPLMNLQ